MKKHHKKEHEHKHKHHEHHDGKGMVAEKAKVASDGKSHTKKHHKAK